MKKKPFEPQIKNVEILNYPVKAGSGNWGIAADVLGERKRHVISLIQQTAWKKAAPEEKPLVAMEIAASSFRNDLLEHFNMNFKKIQSAQELMYHLWNSTGRKAEGMEWEIGVRDKKFFPGEDEVEMTFDVHDGFAVGEFEGKEYVMFYPTKMEVRTSETKKQNISNYIGQAVRDTGIIPADIALTYGEIKMVNDGPKDREQLQTDESERGEAQLYGQIQKNQVVSDIQIRQKLDGQIYISCQVFGERQIAKPMTGADVRYYQQRMASSDKAYNGVAPELAQKYFKNEIDCATSRRENQGVKR